MSTRTESVPTCDPTTAPEQRHPDSHRSLVLLFSGLMVTMLLASLNGTVLSTALPTIVGELDGADHMAWVITAYILASTITMPIYGKLGDLFGRKKLLIGAITIFMAGSVAGALATGMGTLILARGIQGLGGGGLMILAQATIADVVPARERGRYMGIMGGVFAVSSVAGPLLGGWFTEGPGWRWAFWINLPLGALAIGAAVAFLHPAAKRPGRPKVDLLGMAVLALATTCLVLVGAWGGSQYAWGSVVIVGLLGATVGLGFAVVRIERRAAEPVLPMHLFADRNFNLTTVAGLLTSVAMFGAISYLPTYLQMTTGASATTAGLLMIPMMGVLLLTSVVSGQYVSRTGRYKWLPVVGSVILAMALALLSTLTIATPLWQFCSFIGIMGLGLGLSMQILVLIVQNSFPLREVGTATAANNYFRQIGASLGSAVVGSIFMNRLATLLADRLAASGTSGGGRLGRLTPALVDSLPDAVREPIIGAYNDALTPILLVMVPLGIIAAVLLAFVREVPLATSIEVQHVTDDVTGVAVPTEADGDEHGERERLEARTVERLEVAGAGSPGARG